MNPNLEHQKAPAMAGFPFTDLASALGVKPRTIKEYIRKGWIEAKPVKWRRWEKQMIAFDWVIPTGEYRRILREGIQPPSDTFDAIQRAAAHKVEVA